MNDEREISTSHGRMLRPLSGLYALWDQLSDIPVDGDGCIAAGFLHFEIGADREAIWSWFEAQNPAFVVGNIQQGRRHDSVRGHGA